MFWECGTSSFKHIDEDPAGIGFGGRSPKGRKKHGGKVNNPYAQRGLDRFSIVLSELESRRAKILRRIGSDTGLVMIRFVQSKGGWAPVVVKLPEEPFKGTTGAKKRKTAPVAAVQLAASNSTTPDQASPREGAKVNATARAKVAPARRASFSWGIMIRRPSRYLPAVIVLTLVSLVVFGRMFAICLASIWWYLLPALGSGRSDGASLRKTLQRKKHASPPQHAETGSSCGVDEVVSSPRCHAKGKRG